MVGPEELKDNDKRSCTFAISNVQRKNSTLLEQLEHTPIRRHSYPGSCHIVRWNNYDSVAI